MPAYDTSHFGPPAPGTRVSFVNPTNGMQVDEVPMLLDTGADVTIVPEHILQALEAKKLDVAYESIRSLGMGPCPTRVDSNLCSMIAARLPVPIPANILSQLADALSDAYRSPDLAAALATTSDLHVAKIALGSTTYTAWVAILEEAERQGQTETLLKQARTDYPHLAPLAAAVSAYTAWAASGRPGGATPASSPVTTEGARSPIPAVARTSAVG